MDGENNEGARIKLTRELLEQGNHDASLQVSFDPAARAVAIDYAAQTDTGRFRLLRSIVGREESEVEVVAGQLSGRAGRLLDHAAMVAVEDGEELVYRMAVTP
jgi:hypothetical protein